MDITTIGIKDQINTDYRTYSMYVIQSRGIPNFYDSITPVQRLILLHVPERFQTTVALVGSVMATGLYHHGDMSLSKAINKLARPFGCSRPMIIGDGFFGSPVRPRPASTRYTKVKSDPHIKEILDKYAPLNVRNAEGNFEFLNLDVPIGLYTHIVGIAVGYRSNILPRKMDDVIKYLNGENKQLKPYFVGFKGNIKKHNGLDKAWLIEGQFEKDDAKMTMHIGDLPPLMKYDSFIVRMHEKLAKHGDNYIKIENNSKKEVDITIRWRDKSTFAAVCEDIEKLTKLAVVEGLIFVKDGSVIEYESISDYLDEFRVHRERVIHNRMVYDLHVYNEELDYLRAKREFLLFMMEKKRKNEEIKVFISKYNKKIAARLDNIKLTALSPETVKKTEEEIKELEKQIRDQKKTIEEQLKKCKALEKTFVSKGKINMKSVPLFDDQPMSIDGVEVYDGEDEDETGDEIEEDED